MSGPRSRQEDLAAINQVWDLYFPFDDFDPAKPWVKAAVFFRDFFKHDKGKKLLNLSLNSNISNGSSNETTATTYQLPSNSFNINTATSISFDYEEFVSLLPPNLSDFPEVLKANAAVTLACCGLGICSLRYQGNSTSPSVVSSNVSSRVNQPIIVRFVNYRPVTRLVNLKSNTIGQFICVKGTVVRVAGVSPLVNRMNFSCTKCGAVLVKNMPDGKFVPPTYCEGDDCKNRSFQPIKTSSCVTVDYQNIRIQELDDDSNDMDPGRVPRTVDVEFTQDLVDLVVPGDVVTVTGLVKALSVESLSGRGSRAKGKGKETSLLLLLIEANAIENKLKCFHASMKKNQNHQGTSHVSSSSSSNNASTQVMKADSQSQQDEKLKSDVVANLNQADYQMISTVFEKFDFAFLVYSLCPLIFGHEHVKAGLLLALAGGSGKHDDSSSSSGTHKSSKISIRPDIHVLVVGDPGMGKSQMLQAASAVSPRGVYVCGNTASKSGLTVTLVKDSSGEFSLEAGALVIADRGVCCIDEFDKMPAEHSALLEAMEQQSISVAKGGIVCSLAARTTILAAANPKGGHYNRSKTILENLKMSAPLLSRFDMIYILVDTADENHDQILANHVVQMHTRENNQNRQNRPSNNMNRTQTQRERMKHKRKRKKHQNRSMEFQGERQGGDGQSEANAENKNLTLKQSLIQRIENYRSRGQKPLPKHMLRKFIGYAKHYCHPKLSSEACKIIQEFYLELREKGASCESTPITTRQLDSMIRLAQARARVELREVATAQDANDIVSLMRDALLDAFTDDAGVVDYSRGGGMTMSKLVKAYVAQLSRVAKQKRDAMFTMQELKEEAKNIKIMENIPDFRDFLDILNHQAYLLKKRNGMYQLTTSSFSQR